MYTDEECDELMDEAYAALKEAEVRMKTLLELDDDDPYWQFVDI